MAVDQLENVEVVNQGAQIQIQGLKKTFNNGSVVACENINLDIDNDEFVVILGPSGCGKTTTLRCIAGLEIPDDGNIIVGDDDVAMKKPKDRDLAFVFQHIALFPHLTVRENIRFGLDMKTDLGLSEKNERVTEVAKLLEIGSLIDRKPNALSGGQQQRVSLGRAMVMEPAAFLLDEPFSALDAQLRHQMRTEVKRLQRVLNTAMIFVTHDQEEAMVLGDKIVIMHDGKIQQAASPDSIYNDPENRFVAEFIGSPSANLIDCIVNTAGSKVTLSTEFGTLALPSRHSTQIDAEDGSDLVFGIRPENIHVNDGQGTFEATVELIEPHGDRDAVHLDIDGYSLRAIVGQDEQVELEESVSVRFDDDRYWLFDAEGERVF